MQQMTEQKPSTFVDRRQPCTDGPRFGPERRQFQDSRDAYRSEVVELSEAIDQYKLRHRRRFITFDELYAVIIDLGYHR